MRTALPGLAALAIVGCSAVSPFTNEVLEQRAANPTPIEMADTTPRAAGVTVLWGGSIADVRVLDRELELGILAFPLDSRGEPQEDDVFLGRFAARYLLSSEAYRYRPGHRITIYGRVDSFTEVPAGHSMQSVPVVTPLQTHLWDEPSGAATGPGWWPFWHFNIQIMGGF